MHVSIINSHFKTFLMCLIILLLVLSFRCTESPTKPDDEEDEPFNNLPLAVEDHYTVPRNDTLDVVDSLNGVLGNDIDIDNDPLTATLLQAPINGTLDLRSDGTFTYIPPTNFLGQVTFRYDVSDVNGDSDDGLSVIDVEPDVGSDFTLEISPDTILLNINQVFMDTAVTVHIFRNPAFTDSISFTIDVGQCGTLAVFGSFNPPIAQGDSSILNLYLGHGSEPRICPINIVGESLPGHITRWVPLTAIVTNWRPQESGTTINLNAVFFSNANNGTAVGLGGTILRTINGGADWTAQSSGTTEHLEDVFFTNANTGTAVGLEGTILRTTNGGATWVPQTSGLASEVSLWGVFFTDINTGTIVGSEGTILRTTNGGATWVPQTSGLASEVWLNGVFFTDASTGTTVGRFGTILRTTNGGVNWTPQASGTNQDLKAVQFTDASIGTVVGVSGTILRTTDGGTTWVPQTSGTAEVLWGVSFGDAFTGVAVGNNGTILRTTNGGTAWLSEFSGISRQLYDVFLVDAETGNAVGSGGRILRREGN
jgi:photosystem II stability/assembly factor-like uncharacterized protein